jgi:DNA-binding HxlR family transcriptional regulator
MTSEKYILTGVNNDTCPTRIMLSAIEGKWKMLLLYHLFNGSQRAGEFERLIPDAKRQVLSQHLKELEANGLVRKEIYPQLPPKVEYHLTDLGASLEPIFRQMYEWGNLYAQQINAERGQTVFETRCIETMKTGYQ